MQNSSVSDSIDRYQRLLASEIKRQKYGKEPASLYEPIRYMMSIGGKRLRPMLTLLSYSLYRDDVESIVPYAIAVESFHNFTLMHDDIMDNAPLRRGNMTVHKKWNTSTAILSGDVMLIKVYDLFLSLDPTRLSEVLKSFNTCAAEVCEGQQWDMEFETTDRVSEKQYLNMIRLKTAVLLGFSLELGAILAGATIEDREALKAFGVNIGIGFQLKDDLLDAYGDPAVFGKQVGGDILANKKTWLLIAAREKADVKIGKQLQSWLTATKYKKQDKISGVKSIFDQLGIPSAAQRKVDQYFKKGFQHFEQASGNAGGKQILEHFTRSLIGRQS